MTKKNKGYTMIEMIIVIAIMAILSGMAFVTLGIIQQAKCNAAATSLDSQIGSLWIKTKALSQGKTQTVATSSEKGAKYPLSMLIRKNDDASDDIRDGSYVIYLGYSDGSSFYEKERCEVLPNVVSLKYTPTPGKDAEQKVTTLSMLVHTDGSSETIATGETDGFLISFNKSDGSVNHGAGTYEIIYNDETIVSIYLDSITGNHYAK